MTHTHRLSGQALRLIEQRDNGSGLFEDGTGRVVVDMRMVEADRGSGHHGEAVAIRVPIRAANQ